MTDSRDTPAQAQRTLYRGNFGLASLALTAANIYTEVMRQYFNGQFNQ